MALTKVKDPVAEIDNITFGTTTVDITSTGGPIDVNVAGNDIVDLTTTAITVDDLVDLVVQNIMTEIVTLSTTSGADGIIQTNATEMEVGTTDTSPLELLVNSIPVLTLASSGRVAIATSGSASDELVDKAYVDAGDAAAGSSSTAATDGSITIDASPTDIIIKWGQATGTGDRTVTFGTAFPSAIYTVVATPQNTGSANSDGWWGVENLATTGFDWNTANRGAYNSNVNWIAIGS